MKNKYFLNGIEMKIPKVSVDIKKELCDNRFTSCAERT